MNDEYFIIYNICGISGKDNTDYYIDAIKTISDQDYKNYKLIISSCLNTEEQIQKIKESCTVNMINVVKEILTVNITFNQAIKTGIKYFGKPKGILYLDSGVKFTENNQLSELIKLFENGNYGMASAQVDNDMGWCWFGLPVNAIVNENFMVPIGRALNLHCQIFDIELYNEFDAIMPDIFRSYCTESTFSFLNAAISKDWVVSGKVKVHHAMNFPNGDINNGDGIDGHSSGFKAPHGTWDDCYEPHNMIDIISDPEARLCGFGYEELRNIFNHDQDCYIANRYCKDPERLSNFIKKNIFRQKEHFKYENIIQETIIC